MECRPWGPTQRGRSSNSSMGFLGPIATPLELETQKMNMETSDAQMDPKKYFGGPKSLGAPKGGGPVLAQWVFWAPLSHL